MNEKGYERLGSNPTEGQACSMLKFANIEITQKVVDEYVDYRNCLKCFGGFSDQEILYLVVSSEDRLILEKRYPNIDFTKTVEKLNEQ